jgi:cytochrome c
MVQRSNGRRRAFAAAALLGILAVTGSTANAAGNACRGEELYQGCRDCHSIDKNDVGPMHKGIVGRPSGAVPGYNYSPALRNAKIVWTEENLVKWLTSPQDFIPGTNARVNHPNEFDVRFALYQKS